MEKIQATLKTTTGYCLLTTERIYCSKGASLQDAPDTQSYRLTRKRIALIVLALTFMCVGFNSIVWVSIPSFLLFLGCLLLLGYYYTFQAAYTIPLSAIYKIEKGIGQHRVVIYFQSPKRPTKCEVFLSSQSDEEQLCSLNPFSV
ncbi:hypothetical protein [Algivirga pacifica]|uniref:Uncharacterized protein n=1 Tax=Algivirga pacifica TaxID=1162670 RepID=A0ABP9DB38_9BACT